MTVLTLGGHQVTLFKPEFNLSEDFEYRDGEKTRHNYDTPDSEIGMCKIIEYQPIRIFISKYADKNFRLLSHRFTMRRKGDKEMGLIDTLCSCKYFCIFCILSNIFI